VEWAVPLYKPLYKGVLRARLSNGEYHRISLVGLDSATLIGRPAKLFEGRIEELRTPDAVVVDQWAVQQVDVFIERDAADKPQSASSLASPAAN
jgi:putative ABC transport system permease protein